MDHMCLKKQRMKSPMKRGLEQYVQMAVCMILWALLGKQPWTPPGMSPKSKIKAVIKGYDFMCRGHYDHLPLSLNIILGKRPLLRFILEEWVEFRLMLALLTPALAFKTHELVSAVPLFSIQDILSPQPEDVGMKNGRSIQCSGWSLSCILRNINSLKHVSTHEKFG